MKPAKVIIVNGASSAGKTSMCHKFQDTVDEPFFLLGIDAFWFTMPPKEIDLQTVSEQYYTWCKEKTADDKEYFRILPGPLLNEIMLARYKAMAAYLERGLNVIADEVFWTREWMLESLRVFKPYICYYVGVFCDDNELSRREVERGDRYLGWARGSNIYSHKDAIYDLHLNNSDKTPAECAEALKHLIQLNPSPSAANQMRLKYSI